MAERHIGLVEDGAMALPIAKMESSYRELFSLVVLRHLDPVPKLPVGY